MFRLFRFRKRTQRILLVYSCFTEMKKRTLHPMEISRWTGVHMLDVSNTLDTVPELFMRVPRRQDGLTQYALITSVAALNEDEVRGMVSQHARRESWLYHAVLWSVLAVLALLAIQVFPVFFDIVDLF